MRCIVFGASGYIGRHLVDYLRGQGHQVDIPLDFSGGRVDLTNKDALKNIIWDVDVVFFLAGVTGTGASFDQYQRFLIGNELSLLNVLNSIRCAATKPRVIFPSTRLVYLGNDGVIDEGSELYPKTIYAVNKIACEHYLAAYSNSFDIPYTVIRLCVPYGSTIGGQYSFGTVGSFIEQARTNRTIRLFGGGTVRRTFTHIEDVCRLTTLTAISSVAANQVFNLPGDDRSLFQVAVLIAKRFGANVEYADWPKYDRCIESGNTVFEAKKIIDALCTSLNYNIEDWANSLQ